MSPRKPVGYRVCLFLLVFFISVSLCHSNAASETFPALNILAVVESVEGSVEVMKPGAKEWTRVEKGQAIGAGASIRTATGASCILKWAGGNKLRLMESSALAIELMTLNPSTGDELGVADLSSGALFAYVHALRPPGSDFKIKTLSATMDTGGARFSVEVTKRGATAVRCAEGAVTVVDNENNHVLLKKMHKVRIGRDEKPENPLKMSISESETFEKLEGVGNPSIEIYDSGASTGVINGRAKPDDRITVNGVGAPADIRGYFSAKMELKPGDNKVTVTAVNKYGLSTTATLALNFAHPAAPAKELPAVAEGAIDIVYPQDGFVTREPSVIVTGKAAGGGGVLVNNMPAQAKPGENSFMSAVRLKEGENIIDVTSGDESGPRGARLRVVRDTTPPDLRIIQPYNLFEAGASGCAGPDEALRCNVVGRTEPGAALFINNARYEMQPDGSFNVWVSLAPAESAITARAKDSAGNVSTVIVQRAFNAEKAVYLHVVVSPTVICANNGGPGSTAKITVTGKNLLGEPIKGMVTISTPAPTVNNAPFAWTGVLTNGTAEVDFTAGYMSGSFAVTATALTGGVSATTPSPLRLLLAGPPPLPGEIDTGCH